MSGLEFGGALDEHLLRDCDDVHEDGCEFCVEGGGECSCPEPDFEQIVADRAEARR